MPAIESSIVFLPRFTTLVGATEFSSLPLDVSRFGTAQFQVWQGGVRDTGGGALRQFDICFEESLDANDWVLGADAPTAFPIEENKTRFFSYSFRLRWFRVRVSLPGAHEPMVTCWAEGILR
jgi:hypothetical protein